MLTPVLRWSHHLQVNMEVEASLGSDMLRGDEVNEVRLRLKEHREERFPYKDDD